MIFFYTSKLIFYITYLTMELDKIDQLDLFYQLLFRNINFNNAEKINFSFLKL